MDAQCLSLVRIKGSPRELGQQQGESTRPQILTANNRVLLAHNEDRNSMDRDSVYLVHAEAQRLLAEREVPPLTEDQEQAFDEIMKDAEQELVAASLG